MSIFSDNELRPAQIDKLNKLLPQEFNKGTWKMSDFKGVESIYERYSRYIQAKKQEFISIQKGLEKKVTELESTYIQNIKIFNTEIFEAEPLGMVDIGVVERFGAQSSGDRFAAGPVGYAIETAFEDVYAKSNVQEKAVNNAKYVLLKKTKKIYPECNLLFKYEVDFREMGSSGNVFIYMRGTAAKGKNQLLAKSINKIEDEIKGIEKNLSELKAEIEKMQEIKSKIPESKKSIDSLLG